MKRRIAPITVLLALVSISLASCSFVTDFSTFMKGEDSSSSSNFDSSSNEESSSSSNDASISSNEDTSSSQTASSSSSNEPSSSSSSLPSSSASSSSSSSSAAPIEPLNGGLTANAASYTYADYCAKNEGEASTPSVGRAHILVVPIWFQDSNTYIATANKELVRSDIATAYFGTNQETGWRSVKTYYEEESHGALTLTGTVSEWYTESRYSSSFKDENSGVYAVMSLVDTVTNWYFDKHQDDAKSNYDRNGDGYMDGVMLIYGRADYSAKRESTNNFWAYCYKTFSDPGTLEDPNPNSFFWASYDFMYGSTKAAERTGVSSRPYHSGDTSSAKVDAHTFIHEMGHMYGLDDYYDYSGQYNPAAGFSMQDNNVGGHDPFSSFALGWGKAFIPNKTVTIELKPFVSSGEMIILTPKWNDLNSPFDEYLIVEYFTPTGLNQLDCNRLYANHGPKGPKTSGIRVWHIDARLLYYDDEYGRDVSNIKVTNDPTTSLGKYVGLMMSNTYFSSRDSGSSAYASPLGMAYGNYNVLQLIRNDTTETYCPTSDLSSTDLFVEGDAFTPYTFKNQFVSDTNAKLNCGKYLGYSFTVDAISSESATIRVTKD